MYWLKGSDSKPNLRTKRRVNKIRNKRNTSAVNKSQFLFWCRPAEAKHFTEFNGFPIWTFVSISSTSETLIEKKMYIHCEFPRRVFPSWWKINSDDRNDVTDAYTRPKYINFPELQDKPIACIAKVRLRHIDFWDFVDMWCGVGVLTRR